MENTQLQKRAKNALGDIESTIDNLIAEIESLEEINQKQHERIEELEAQLNNQ